MTLGGLALAVGTVVDAGIVVVENIIRHLDRGESRQEASRKGAEEVASPVLAGTVTTLAIFLPALFLSGMVRYLFEPLALSAAVSIAASYVFAMTLLPAFCARFFRERRQETTDAGSSEVTNSPSWYGVVLQKGIQSPWLTSFGIVAVAAAVAFSCHALGRSCFRLSMTVSSRSGYERYLVLVLKIPKRLCSRLRRQSRR